MHTSDTNGPALRAMSPLTIHAGVSGRYRAIPVGAVCVGATGHLEKHACPAIHIASLSEEHLRQCEQQMVINACA